MGHILGRYEHSASDYYNDMLENARHYYEEPIKRMSHLTENLLKGIDYSAVRKKRTENYAVLASALNNTIRFLYCIQMVLSFILFIVQTA